MLSRRKVLPLEAHDRAYAVLAQFEALATELQLASDEMNQDVADKEDRIARLRKQIDDTQVLQQRVAGATTQLRSLAGL